MSRAATTASDGWSRNRLLAILACAVVVALIFVFGFIYAIVYAIGTATGHGSSSVQMDSSSQLGVAHENAIAAAPMLQVTQADAMPGTPTTQTAPSMSIPLPTDKDNFSGVAIGFPHTPQGAVAQLGAIGQVVLSSMSIDTTKKVYEVWTQAGAPDFSNWQLTQNVVHFLGHSGGTNKPAAGVTVTATPAAAQIKGTDGPDWTLACVLFQMTAVQSTTTSMGYGYCARMQWFPDSELPIGGRWVIGPGSEAAPAPSTWPGSAKSLQAGWQEWVTPSNPVTPSGSPQPMH
jgi:hypothetical protein